MITKKIVCDRCKKVILDSENENEFDVVGLLFGKNDGKELGYAELNIVRIDGKCTKTMHFCEECYSVAVKAWNEGK